MYVFGHSHSRVIVMSTREHCNETIGFLAPAMVGKLLELARISRATSQEDLGEEPWTFVEIVHVQIHVYLWTLWTLAFSGWWWTSRSTTWKAFGHFYPEKSGTLVKSISFLFCNHLLRVHPGDFCWSMHQGYQWAILIANSNFTTNRRHISGFRTFS